MVDIWNSAWKKTHRAHDHIPLTILLDFFIPMLRVATFLRCYVLVEGLVKKKAILFLKCSWYNVTVRMGF